MKTAECEKCCGTGIVATAKHVLGGVCFSCNGTGKRHVLKRVKVTFPLWAVVMADGTIADNQLTSLDAAQKLAADVADMWGEPATISQRESYTFKTERILD